MLKNVQHLEFELTFLSLVFFSTSDNCTTICNCKRKFCGLKSKCLYTIIVINSFLLFFANFHTVCNCISVYCFILLAIFKVLDSMNELQ